MPTQRLEEKRVEEHVGEGERERWREREMERERGRERERVHAHGKERECSGSSCYMFLPPPGPAPGKLGLAGVLFVLPEVFTLVLGPTFALPCFLATAILDSFSQFYLPNRREN